jgi:dihydrofolate reductase
MKNKAIYKIITCCDKLGGIGIENKLPWHLPEDLQWFKSLTFGCTVIMGRKTFESLGNKPLPHRFNIVITNNNMLLENKHGIDNLLFSDNLLNHDNNNELWVIGGSNIYKSYIDIGVVGEIYMTVIDKTFDCDTTFPVINNSDWNIIVLSRTMESRGGLLYKHLKYTKK